MLEAFAAGRVRRLIVTMPPQHGKSVGATTLLPAYVLGLDPDQRVAIASYSGALASKFNRRVQRIIESREYAAFFPATTIKQGSKPPSYIRTADEVEIIGWAVCCRSAARARSRATASIVLSSTTSTRTPSKPIRRSSAPTAGSGIRRWSAPACTMLRVS